MRAKQERSGRARTWVLGNQKGGCGKTTAAINLAACLARASDERAAQRVLLVDLDPQAHATLGLGQVVVGEPTVADVLRSGLHVREAARRVPGAFDLLPACSELAEFEEESARILRPERLLEGALAAVAADYDWVLVDCPPRADGILTANALRASDGVMLVVETGAFALQGALEALRLFRELCRDLDRELEWRVLATLFDRRTKLAREILIAMQARFGEAMFDTAIHHSVRLREAAAFGVPVVELDRRSRASSDFQALADEVLARVARPLRAGASLSTSDVGS